MSVIVPCMPNRYNTETSRQAILRLEGEVQGLAKVSLATNLKLKAANEVVKEQGKELADLRRIASGQSALDSNMLDALDADPSLVAPVWTKKKPAPPAYFALRGSSYKFGSFREALEFHVNATEAEGSADDE